MPFPKGGHHTIEAKQKMSIAQSGGNNGFYGKHHTAETKALLRQIGKQRKVPEDRKQRYRIMFSGEGNPMYGKAGFGGKHHTMETVEHLKLFPKHLRLRYSIERKGSGNPNWRGGFESNYNPDFWIIAEQIRDRDDHLCQLCYISEAILSRLLDVHHIDYNSLNDDFFNLISLCSSCHGKVQSNREYWQLYFEEYQCLRNLGKVKNLR